MNQLAEELNLSRRVVSAVMNNRSRELRISPATEKRVREHLAASGYVRSKSALQLKSGKDNDMIGILYCGKFIDLEYLTASLTLLTQEIRALCGFSVGILWPGTFSLSMVHCPEGGTAMVALFALAGDVGCALGPGVVGAVSGMAGGALKAGLLAACAFPVLLLLAVSRLRRRPKGEQ